MVRILILFGLMVLSIAVVMFWQRDRPANPEKAEAPPGETRVGRSTLSHGGADISGLSDAQGRSMKPAQNIPSDPPPKPTKR